MRKMPAGVTAIYERRAEMREIKFKGRREDTGKWVKGYYMCLLGVNGAENSHFIIDEHGEYHRIDPDTLCEYIGLHADNKEEIYEGDIIKCSDLSNDFEFVAIVEFGNPNGQYNWGWQLHIIGGVKDVRDVNPDILCWVETEIEETTAVEILGNTHDAKLREATE